METGIIAAPGRLVPDVYGTEFRRKDGPFGIACGQMRTPSVIHNGGWYNKFGEKIGWGDLSESDLRAIKDGLLVGERFIILTESDSFWNFVVQYGAMGYLCKTTPDEKKPGPEYIAKYAFLIVAPGKIYVVERLGWEEYAQISRKDAAELLK